jgi:hypothetical protein
MAAAGMRIPRKTPLNQPILQHNSITTNHIQSPLKFNDH